MLYVNVIYFHVPKIILRVSLKMVHYKLKSILYIIKDKKGRVTMENKEAHQEKCEFTIYPSDIEVKIKEVKPFSINRCNCLVLNLQVITDCNINSCIKIKSKPQYGNLYFFDGSILIYKPTTLFSVFDSFQILIQDEFGGIRIESIIVHVIC